MDIVNEEHAFSAEVMRDPRAFDQTLLRDAPIRYDSVNGFFLVSSYALIDKVLKTPTTFSSEYIEKIIPQRALPNEVQEIYAQGCPFTKALLVTDGDEHKRHRRIINKALSRPRLEEILPALDERIEKLLMEILPRKRMLFRQDFANAVPILITQQLLHIPDEDLSRALEWSEVVSSGFGGLQKSVDKLKQDAQAIIEFQHYFTSKLSSAMNQVTQAGGIAEDDYDLCRLLAAAILDPADPMTLGEALSFLLVLFPATHDTTTGTLVACMHSFTHRPDVQTRIADEPEFLPRFIDEAMRHESPNRAFWRRAKCNTTLGDETIPAGSWLLLRLTAANYDPSVFPEPEKFNPDRRFTKPNLEFGTGIHMCVGRPLARQIISFVFKRLVSSARNFRFTDKLNDFTRERSLLFSSYAELDIEFDLLSEAN